VIPNMRRWFRKKDPEPADPENEAVGPRDEASQDTAPAAAEETPPAGETREPETDASLPTEAESPEGASDVIHPEADTAVAGPRRGFFRRLFLEEQPLEEMEPAAEEALPEMESQPLTPEEVPEQTVAAEEEEEPIIELEAELTDEELAAIEPRKRRFRRFRERLVRTRKSLAGGLESLFLGDREVDAEVLDELEEILISADIGVDTTLRLVEVIRDKVKRRELRDTARLKEALREEMVALLTGPLAPARTAKPWVVLLVGVNGVGKTTTIAKLAHQDRSQGLSPLLIAADTFRAAAVEQLEIWGERVGAQVVKQKTGADPAAVVFDGLAAAQAREVDTVYVDTAGRLHTKVNLMEELKKIHRTATKKLTGAPHETLLILDATTGQNALNQVRMFDEAVGVTGIILTKLDGTAKGGMALAVAHETGLPLRFLGVGEGMDDLQPFDPEAFVAAILD
jgi:fused signal recognition particle receptor